MQSETETKYKRAKSRQKTELIKTFMEGGLLLLMVAIVCSIWLFEIQEFAAIVILGVLALIVASLSWANYEILDAPADLCDWQIYDMADTDLVRPFSIEQIEPNSYDVLLGNKFSRILENGTVEEFNAEETILEPGEFLLAHTMETFKFPKNIKGILQGKSSWARLAVFVEAAGLFDAGFEGTAVLELYNCGKHAVKLRKGEKIAQMSFHRTFPTALPYGPDRGSHYQGQKGAEKSWLGKMDRIVPKQKTQKA